MSKNLSHLAGRKGLNYNLFEELGIAATESGTPDPAKMEQLRHEFLFGSANVYGAVSFYDFLKEENKGKKIYLCNGSSCITAGTQDGLKAEISKHFSQEEIGEMCCLGRCHENTSFHYNGKNYSGESIHEISEIVEGAKVLKDKYAVLHSGTPVLTAEYGSVEDYYTILRESLKRTPVELLEELKTANLRGRGGAGFPMGLKLESCRNSPGKEKFIVCNADEGDPGAYSDRYIMEERPHSLLMGMILAGYMVGAEWGVLYIRAEYPESVDIISEAVAHLESLGYCGENILGSGFTFKFKVIKAQGAYICGEETALLSSLEGQRPEVRVRPPYPTQQGLFNMPTVVNNVETLAAVPYIMKHGGSAYASIGSNGSKGTKLISLDGFFKKPGMYEVDMGTPLASLIYDMAGGFKSPVKAMHIGGPLGGLVPIEKIEDLNVSFESFAENGFLLGHASIVCIPDEYPMVEYLKHLFQFTAHESCGKCFPCRLGSTRGYEMLEKATSSDYKIERQLMDDLLETLEIGSLCALGGGLPLPIKNAMQYFEDELAEYFS
jgi:NADH-quinone oxidoreductase subunit F